MTNFFQKLFSGSKSEESAPESSERLQEYEQIFKLAKKKNLTDEKKAELEALYVQLMRKSDNVTSGQLQFLGLAEIKSKMGPAKWAKLQSKVYATAEDVIQHHVTLSDIYFLYQEDRYVIIFTQSTDEEINRKVSAISDEIGRRFSEFEEKELQSLQIQQEIKKVDVETFLDTEFSTMLDFVFKQYNPGYQPGGLSTDIPMTYKPAAFVPPPLDYRYLPLWDTDKKNLTTFMCFSQEKGHTKPVLDGYRALFQGKTLPEKTAFDIAMLEKVIEELEKMEYEERDATLICPVQLETVYNFSSYDEYKNACQTIPNSKRDSIIFLVTNSENFSLPAKDPFWFIPLMKEYCGGVLVDIPMRENMQFHGLKSSGALGFGMHFTPVFSRPEQNMNLLSNFMSHAKAMHFKKSFIYDLDDLDTARSLVRLGFTHLSGPVVSDYTRQPEASLDPELKATLTSLAK